MAVNDVVSDVPEEGAVFTFGKCKFNGNKPGKFWLKDEKVEDIACGDEHTVLKSEYGKLYTFGNNSWGQLGLGHTDGVDKPTRIKKLSENPVLQVACGKSHTLVLTINGSTYGFGCNIDGQTNPSEPTCSIIADPVKITIAEDEIILLSAGADHSAALTKYGVVMVWGSCGYLQLDSQMPAKLRIEEKVKSISCGYYHNTILTERGNVICYGEVEGGKLGIGVSNEEYLGPTRIESIKEPIKIISSGHSHTFVITESGKAMSFGDGFQGQLGQGTMVMSCDEPQIVPLEQNISHVSCGESHTAMITEDNKLLICGDGRHGKLCFDNLSNYFTFSLPKIFADVDVLKVACGGCHTVVLARPKNHNQHNGKEIHAKKLSDVDSCSSHSEEHQEFNADSLARSRRRIRKQDNQISFNNKKTDIMNRLELSNSPEESNEDPNLYSIQSEKDNFDGIDKLHIEGTSNDGLKRNTRKKTIHRSQPKMDDNSSEGSNNNYESTAEHPSSASSKTKKSSKTGIKSDSFQVSAPETKNQRVNEQKKSKLCSIL